MQNDYCGCKETKHKCLIAGVKNVYSIYGSSDVIEPQNIFQGFFLQKKKIIRMSYSYNMSYDNERRSGLLYDLWDLKKALEYMSSLSTPHTVDYPQPTLGPTVALFLTDGRLGKSFFQSLDYLTKPPFFRSAER